MTDAAPTVVAPPVAPTPVTPAARARRRFVPPRFAPLLCVAAVCGAATAARAEQQDLLAHGTGEQFWVVRMAPEPGTPAAARQTSGVQARVFARPSGEGWSEWWQPLGRRVVSVASRDSQLAVLLDDGQWLLVSESNAVSGRPIAPPGQVPTSAAAQGPRLITLGGDRGTLWAVARLPGGIASLTPPPPPPAPATAPRAGPATAASTRPGTQPAADRQATPSTTLRSPGPTTAAGASSAVASTRGASVPEAPLVLSLVRLSPNAWVGVGDLPPEVARPGEHELSLVVLEDVPHLAVRATKGSASRDVVEIYRLADAGRWERVGSAAVPADARHHKLLSGTPVPTLAITAAKQGDPDLLYIFGRVTTTGPSTAPAANRSIDAGESGALAQVPATRQGVTRPTTGPAPVPLQATASGRPAERAVAAATGMIRAVYAADQGPGKDPRLLEQRYDLRTGAPEGSPAPLLAQAEVTSPVTVWRWAVVTVAMIYAVVASFRRREQMRRVGLEQVRERLAPLGSRIMAGLLDALPVIASMVVFVLRMDARGFEAATNDWYASPITWIGLGLYVLHTTLSEVLTGRTAGKALAGLRVVSLDGSPPARGQFLTRNLLRIIDAGLLFIPAMLVPLSPLRQRVGDAAAGTLVVSAAAAAEGDEGDADSGDADGGQDGKGREE